MGKLIRASALTLLLACSASAGIMTHGVYDPPPPPPQQQTSQEAQEPVAAQGTAETDEAITPLVIQIALNLFALL